ncbi:putative GNAT family acetyltransferase [Xylogone sp. PMI_703]|nr:putative GNAT family acetyltransferase [Xylogone sp. PMI_703]
MSKHTSLGRVEILPVEEADALTLAEVETEAFQSADGRLGLALFGPPSASGHEHRAKELVASMKEPNVKLVKAVMDGQIVAWAQWRFYTDPLSPPEWEDKEFPPPANPVACNEFFKLLFDKRNAHMTGKRFAHLNILVTLPNYQGLGLGSKLLRQGLDEADKASLSSWLEATARGLPVYRKFGYEGVDKLELDLTRYGGDGMWTNTCMLRPAKE